jgi:cysteine desulfurase
MTAPTLSTRHSAPIYLDYAATTPLAPEVLDAMLPWLREGYGNPASEHAPGLRARAAVEQARAQVAALIGAAPEEIIWTSGATESNNLAIKGALEFRGARNAHAVTSRIEHKSVLDTFRHLETLGTRVTYLKPDAAGRIHVEQVLQTLMPETALVSLMWVNNEIGVINPVIELAPLLRERGILFHVDAVQAAGKLPIDLAQLPVDLLSLSAHKLYGPKGVGALFVRKSPRARLAPQIHGGGHEQGMRSGTLATHQIVGMGAAFRLAAETMAVEVPRLASLRDQLWRQLQAALPRIHCNGAAAPRAAHILNVSFEGAEGESLRAMLGDIAVSSGSACSSATREPSFVLRALGRDDELAGSSLRFSLGCNTTAQEIEQAAARVIEAVRWLRELSPVPQASARHATPANDGNAFGYAEPIWQRFSAPTHAGELQGEGVLSAEAGSPAAKSQLRLQVKLGQGLVTEAAFRAYGCPTAIAVGEWLATGLVGKKPADWPQLTASKIRQALEIPDDRAHCALMGEDVVRALAKQV